MSKYEQSAGIIAATLQKLRGALPEVKAAPAADGDYNAQDVSFALGMLDEFDDMIDAIDAQALGGKNAEAKAIAERVRTVIVAESDALTAWLAARGVSVED